MVKARDIGTMMLGLAVVLVSAGCDDNPLSEGRTDTVRFRSSHSFVVVDAADTVSVEALPVNNFTEPTGAVPTATACDAGVSVEVDPDRVEFQSPGGFIIIGEQLGPSCIEVSADGVVDTIDVRVVPASMEAEIGTVSSGQTGVVSVSFFDAAGDEITGMDESDLVFESDSEAVGEIDESGTVTGKTPGTTTVSASLNPELHAANRSADAELVVEPGPFGGTLSAQMVEPYDTVTITAADGQPFDDDTSILYDGFPLIESLIVSQDETSIEFIVPAERVEGETEAEVIIVNVGEDQLGLAPDEPITITSPGEEDPFEPNDAFTEAVPIDLPFHAAMSMTGTDEDWFIFELDEETTVDIVLDWNAPPEDDESDLDIEIYDVATGVRLETCFNPDRPEQCDQFTFEAGSYYLRITVWDLGPDFNDRLTTTLTINTVEE